MSLLRVRGARLRASSLAFITASACSGTVTMTAADAPPVDVIDPVVDVAAPRDVARDVARDPTPDAATPPGRDGGVTLRGSLSIGQAHTCERTDDGRVLCWGGNAYGELGDGTTTPRAGVVEVPRAAGAATRASSSERTEPFRAGCPSPSRACATRSRSPRGTSTPARGSSMTPCAAGARTSPAQTQARRS